VFLSGIFPLLETLELWENDANTTFRAWSNSHTDLEGRDNGKLATVSGGINVTGWSQKKDKGVWQATAVVPPNVCSIFVGGKRRIF
jgi:hypothetical protein